MGKSKPTRAFWICLALCFAAAAVCLIYPLYVIRPFRHQEPRELMIALTVIRYRPFVVALAGLSAIAALIWYWRLEPGKWKRTFSTIGVVLVVAVAALSRINVFEIMFHPMGPPAFSAASQSKLDGDEKVIAVKVGQSARAYPIRIVSYHHVINDIVDGEPIVATY